MCHLKKISLPSSLQLNNGSILITPYKQEFLNEGRLLIREMFPLNACCSSTIHKVQGLSLDKAVIHFGTEDIHKRASICCTQSCQIVTRFIFRCILSMENSS